MNRWAFIIALLFGLVTSAFGRQVSYQDMVVMIDTKFAESGSEFGAGIVVGESEQRTVIVTAAHVVESRQSDELASNIQVEFRSLRGKTFKASVTRSYIDLKADLAVIFVDKQPGTGTPLQLDPAALDVISPSKPQALSGATVQVIGAMGKRRWATGVNTDKIISATGTELRLSTDEAQAGASGGAVFDTLGRLLGMCSHIDSPTPVLLAVPMPAIMRSLERWGIPVSITYAKAGTSSPELLAQIQTQLHIDVIYLKPEKYDPQQPLGGSAPKFPHRIVAKLSPGLKALSPKVEVSYVQVSGQTAKIALTAPDYQANVDEEPAMFQGEVWATFADGRRLGPMHVKLDFESGPVSAASTLGPRAQDTLKYARESMKVEERNRTVGEQQKQAVAENFAAVNLENQKVNDERKRKLILAGADRWSIECINRYEKWKCSYPAIYSSDVQRLMHSFRMGPGESDLYIELPLDSDDDFRQAIVAETTKLLATNDTVSAIYVRAQLASGEVIGPQAICHVRRNPRSKSAYCTNY